MKLAIEASTSDASYTAGATPILLTILSHVLPFPLVQLNTFMNGVHAIDFCFRYGVRMFVLKFLSLVTSILFLRRRYSPSCRTRVVLQEANDSRIMKAVSIRNNLLISKTCKFISILAYLKILTIIKSLNVDNGMNTCPECLCAVYSAIINVYSP